MLDNDDGHPVTKGKSTKVENRVTLGDDCDMCREDSNDFCTATQRI